MPSTRFQPGATLVPPQLQFTPFALTGGVKETGQPLFNLLVLGENRVMKMPGMIGGLGPESTIDYYRSLIAMYRERNPDGSHPPILINSLDLKRVLEAAERREFAALADYLSAGIEKLARAGAEFAFIAANTPHIVFDQVRARSPIPLISIVEATCEAARALGLQRVGLFGTRFTMQARFYPEGLSGAGIALLLPSAEEQAYVHEKYLGELVKAVFLSETKAGLLRIADRMRDEDGMQGLILGGTELPLLLKNVGERGYRLLDTTQIHVQAVVQEMLS
jgi:aspartate racemase